MKKLHTELFLVVISWFLVTVNLMSFGVYRRSIQIINVFTFYKGTIIGSSVYLQYYYIVILEIFVYCDSMANLTLIVRDGERCYNLYAKING